LERDDQLMLSFLKNCQGATAIEYGLIVALIFLVIVISVTTLGDNLGILYDDVANKVTDAL
jgi:pilus assembly protein Flp/PilA